MSRTGKLVALALVAAAGFATAGPATAIEPGPTVVGGVPADITAVPYQVALVAAGVPAGTAALRCGGTIIDPSWVVTAAHCVAGVAPSRLRVVAGVTKLSDMTRVHRIAVDRIVVHPAYDARADTGDVALMHVTTPLPATRARLNTSSTLPTLGTSLLSSGWGTRRSGGTVTNRIRTVELQDRAGVSASCGQYGGTYVAAKMLCAGWPGGGRDTCQGDSGGPLVARGANGPVLVGIVSFGYGCGRADYPGVYTRVSTYAAWIRQIVPSAT